MRMKNFIIFIIFLLLPFAQLSASEIFGNISTNPQTMNNEESNSPNPKENEEDGQEETEEENKSSEINFSGSGSVLLVNQEDKKEENKESEEEVVTLGISAYVDGTLLRGEDNKIYLISKEFKIYISSMEKLKEYSGQVIYNVGDEELANYKDKKYFISDLIREQGDVKVFAITDSGLKHILNLEKLRSNYFGLEIFNLSREEMDLYK